ncbi:MAG: GNAT family N-acetyltransferase [Promethearchaeota archaeon]
MVFNIDDYKIESFTTENINDIHTFFEKHAGLYSLSIEEFKNATIEDQDFDPILSIVLKSKDCNEIIAAFFAIIRKTKIFFKKREINYTFTTLNLFAVHQDYRRKGIGSALLKILFSRLKKKKRRKVKLMTSVPNYLWPGLDPRYTEAYFFLKKNRFKRGKGEKKNLIYYIPENLEKPPRKLNGVTISRITPAEFSETVEYIKKYHAGFWPVEVQLSFKNQPCTTFIAKDENDKVIGFASHSIGFKGSFGPTGVKPSFRGQGIGGTLLKWCAWDLKQQGINRMIIRWVEGNTIKFYCKSIGARIHQVYWTMHRRI